VTLHALPHLLASAISVDFDLTFLAQFVLFTAFITVLKPLLFDPLLKVFEEREKRTEGAKMEAREMDLEAGELLTRYEAALERVRQEAGRDREKRRGEAAAPMCRPPRSSSGAAGSVGPGPTVRSTSFRSSGRSARA
jgi:F-type H+-transporting ATPase subunit b